MLPLCLLYLIVSAEALEVARKISTVHQKSTVASSMLTTNQDIDIVQQGIPSKDTSKLPLSLLSSSAQLAAAKRAEDGLATIVAAAPEDGYPSSTAASAAASSHPTHPLDDQIVAPASHPLDDQIVALASQLVHPNHASMNLVELGRVDVVTEIAMRIDPTTVFLIVTAIIMVVTAIISWLRYVQSSQHVLDMRQAQYEMFMDRMDKCVFVKQIRFDVMMQQLGLGWYVGASQSILTQLSGVLNQRLEPTVTTAAMVTEQSAATKRTITERLGYEGAHLRNRREIPGNTEGERR